MDEKDTPKVVQEIKETSQPAEVKTQPTVEELQKEIERKEQVIKDTKRELSEARKRGVPKEELDSLHKKIDDMQEWTASIMDDLATKISGEEVAQPTRKTYRQQLDERKVKTPKPEIDPQAQRFFDLLEEENLDFESDFVKESIKDTKTPIEAIRAIKAKLKEQKLPMEDIDKRIQDGIKIGIEKELKERGLTTSGAVIPSSAIETDSAFLKKYGEGKSDDHKRAKQILDKMK